MLLPCLVELWDHKLDAELLIFSFAPEQQVQTHDNCYSSNDAESAKKSKYIRFKEKGSSIFVTPFFNPTNLSKPVIQAVISDVIICFMIIIK